MDPVSILSTISFAGSCTSILARAIYSVCQAPAEIMALQNEVSDLQLLLMEWHHSVSRHTTQQESLIQAQDRFLTRSDLLLGKLAALTNSLYKLDDAGRHHFQRHLWPLKKPKVLQLKQEISSSIQALRDIMSIGNEVKLNRIELRLSEIDDSLVLLLAKGTSLAHTGGSADTANQSTSFTITASVSQPCGVQCCCRCHRRNELRSPVSAINILGQIFIGYVGSPVISAKCETRTCSSSQARSFRITYTFPSWFIRRSVQIVMGADRCGNLEAVLKVRHRRDNTWPRNIFSVAWRGQLGSMRRALSSRLASPNDLNLYDGHTPFHHALWYAKETKDLTPCRDLIKCGADLQIEDDCGLTDVLKAARLACTVDDPDFRHDFMSLVGLDDLTDTCLLSSLHEVVLGILAKDIDQALQEQPYDLDVVDVYGRSPLHWAAYKDDQQTVRALLAAGADVNLADYSGSTPLHLAAMSGSEKCLDILISAGAQVWRRNVFGQHAIDIAVGKHDNPLVVQSLHAAGVKVDGSCRFRTVLPKIAATWNHVKTLKALLDLGADPNGPDDLSWTPLFAAVNQNNVEALQVLLQYDLDFQHVNTWGWSILHVLAYCGQMSTLRLLWPHIRQCDTASEDREKRTPLDAIAYRIEERDEDFEREFRRFLTNPMSKLEAGCVEQYELAPEWPDRTPMQA